MDPEPATPEFLMEIQQIKTEPVRDGFQPIRIVTSRGEVECRYYSVGGANSAAIWVGGAGGGWDTPAHDLYPKLCQDLLENGIASLRVRYRHPAELEESILDVLAGVAFLEEQGIRAVSFGGWSFGGAVVIQAAAETGIARTVVTFATQSYGAGAAAHLPDQCSILLLHGTADKTLSPSCSQYVQRITHEPKKLILLPGADHGFSQVADKVHQMVREWILKELRPPATG